MSLKIYDAAGRLVRTLAEGPEGVGDHSVSWDGRDDSGAAMSSGVYFYRLSTPAGTVAKSMTFVR